MDRIKIELFFYELFESEKCKSTSELMNIAEQLADCMNTAILDYCSDEGIDNDGAPSISVDEY